jgi:glutamate racemase
LGLDIAKEQYLFPVVGVNTGVRVALDVSRHQNIGVIATQATITSGKHQTAILSNNSQATVYPQSCPKFVPLIEQVQLEGEVIEDAAAEYLAPLKKAGVDTLILGCTHYPLISPLLNRIMGPDTVLVNPAHETALDAYAMLVAGGQLADRKQGRSRLCFSADLKRAAKLAALVLPAPLPELELINLQDFS